MEHRLFSPSRAVNTTRSNIKGGKKSLEGLSAVNAFEQVQLYPNPAGSVVNVVGTGSGNLKLIEIVDLMGKAIIIHNFEGHGLQNRYPVSLTGLAKGIYTVKVETDLGKVIKKLVIQ